MSKCPKCGSAYEDGAKFCDECGTPLPQEKECPKCHAHIGLSAKFCDECGFSFENSTGKQPSISMGDKNVIAGDVVAHKESYEIKGNATIVKNEDESKKMVQCPDCGKNIPVSQSFECPSCHRIVCEGCFDWDSRKCKKCCGENSSVVEEKYRTAIVEVLSDGKIDVAERKKLMSLLKQLGLSAARAIQIEKEVKSASAVSVESKNTAVLDKVNLEKAYDYLYMKGDYKKAAELLAPILERNPNNENVLALYLAALTKFNPVKARKVVETLRAEVLSGALSLIDIDLKRKDWASVEKRIVDALAIWPDSALLKCRKAIYAYEMFKVTEDSAPLMEAVEILESIGDCKDAVEKSWKFFAKGLIDSALGDTPEQITAENCSARGLLWDIISQNEDKSNTLYRIIDLSDGPSAKFYPTYYMDTESIFDWPDEFKTDLIVLRRIQPGRFVMGKGPRVVEDDTDSNTHPEHIVTLTRAYYIGVYTVTQRQWELVTGDRPSFFSKNECYAMRPVENIGYDDLRGKGVGAKWPVSQGVDSNSFIGILRKRTEIVNIDLPTEAQWEYACRAGTSTDFNDGYDIPEDNGIAIENVAKVARFNSELGGLDCDTVDVNVGTAIVGSYKPNQWGIYDMHGNVAEICIDANPPDNCIPPLDMPQINPLGFSGNQYETIDDVGHGCVRGGDWSETEPEKLTSWVKSYFKRVSDGGVRLAMSFNGEDPDIEKWGSVSDTDIGDMPKEIYDKAVELSAKEDLAAKLIVARVLYCGTSYLDSQKERSVCLCKEMAKIGYGPAQTFLGKLALDAGDVASAVEYFRNAAAGGDTKGLIQFKIMQRGVPEFTNKILEYLHTLEMDYVCVDKKLKRMIPKFRELAQKYFGIDECLFPKRILGALADDYLGSGDETNDSFVLFGDDGIYLILGWGWCQFNKFLSWEDVAKHGKVVKNDSTIQLSSSPFALTWGAWQGDEDAEVFSRIVAIAKEFYKPALSADESSESDSSDGESVGDEEYESDEETTDDEGTESDVEPIVAKHVKKHQKYRIEIHSSVIEIGRQKFASQEELDGCDREKYDSADKLETYDMSCLLDCGELKVYCEGEKNPVFSTKLDPGIDNAVIAYKDDGELFGGELDFGNGEVYLYVKEEVECRRVSEIELDGEFDPSKLEIVYRTFTHSADEEICLIWSVEYDGKKLERRFEAEDDGDISSWTENEEEYGGFDIWEKPVQNGDEEDDDSESEEEDDDDEEDDSESEDEDDKDDEEESEADEDENEEDEIPDFSDVGMANETSTQKSDRTSDRKRIVYLLLGVFLGFVGLHFKYACRKVLFHLTWLSFVSFVVGIVIKQKLISGILGVAWLALWLGGAVFVKKDGHKKAMKWF